MTEFKPATAFSGAMSIVTQEDADAYYQALLAHLKSLSPELSDEEIARNAKVGIGYETGYHDHEVRQRVETLFRCEHPVFGSFAKEGTPDFKETFLLGAALMTGAFTVGKTTRSYIGERSPGEGCEVKVLAAEGRKRYKLPLYLGVMKHSPTGFEWGYEGSGPAQLALAILMDFLKAYPGMRSLFKAYLKEPREAELTDEQLVIGMHQDFKRAVVACFDGPAWSLTNNDVTKAVVKLAAKYGRIVM